MKLTVNDMLKTVPEPKDEITPIYEKLQPLSFELFQKFAAIADPDLDIVDAVNLEYKQKTDSDRLVWTGLVHKGTGDSHGVVRVTKADGHITESTRKEGNIQGLVRVVSKN